MKKSLIKYFVIIAGIVVAIKGFGYLLTKESDDFCLSIEQDDTIEIIQSKAKSFGFKVRKRKGTNDKIKLVIPSQDSPFFRFACVVIFKDGKLVSKQVVAAD